jgi:glycosyltransferase involved in cell wall biosynthesis
MRTAVFSILSSNYRHYARVLMASVQDRQPAWDRYVLMVGENAPARGGEPFTTIPVDALALPQPAQFTFRYTLLELNTAVKPWVFAHLFAQGYDRVVYLDPDIVVYSPLAELEALPPETFLALTPHLTGSIDGDEHPSERTILLAGVYNLGFLAVMRRPQLDRFLEWWQSKLEYQCVVDPPRGIFVDQKWMDLTPGLFADVAILRHEGYNVAYWNLGQRRVESGPDGATVNGQPLRFFHFSGADPAAPDMVSRHHHTLKLVTTGGLRPLFGQYLQALRAAGYDEAHGAAYAFGAFADGTRIPDAARIAYRESPELQAAAGADPFAHPELFAGLRDAPRSSRLRARVKLLSYRFFSRARPLVRLFPRPLRTAMREYLLERRESAPRTARGPARRTARGAAAVRPPGLNVAGYITRPSGVGESARLCQKSCDAAGIASHTIDVDRGGTPLYRATIYHVNADVLPEVHGQLPQLFRGSDYNIGCWHWELPELPDAWIASAAPLDEIWAPSAFVQSAISRKLTLPIVHMPHGIAVTELEPCSPAELGVPAGRFTYLCMFDLDSVLARKNPFAAIEAFRRAFPNESAAALLIKAGQSENHPDDYAELAERLRGVPNVYLTDRMLTRARVNGLLAACDGIVSLHRSEGFGLILAEAMYLGKPVIATGWSGNMDFMNSGNSCPVGYDLVTLERSHDTYAAGQQWAEPDVAHAAQLLRRVFDDGPWRAQIGARAQATIRADFSPAAAGRRYRRRLDHLGLLAAAEPKLR